MAKPNPFLMQGFTALRSEVEKPKKKVPGQDGANLEIMKTLSDRDIIEQTLYTSQNMFGYEQDLAESELKRRYPPPDWAIQFWEQDEYGYWRPNKE
jgi:hypothetical protein